MELAYVTHRIATDAEFAHAFTIDPTTALEALNVSMDLETRSILVGLLHGAADPQALAWGAGLTDLPAPWSPDITV